MTDIAASSSLPMVLAAAGLCRLEVRAGRVGAREGEYPACGPPSSRHCARCDRPVTGGRDLRLRPKHDQSKETLTWLIDEIPSPPSGDDTDRRIDLSTQLPPTFTRGLTDGISHQAHQGFRAKPKGPAACRAGQRAGPQAGEPPQARGAAEALWQGSVAPLSASADRSQTPVHNGTPDPCQT